MMFNKKYDLEPILDQAALDLLSRINKNIQHNGPGGNARENCLNWRIHALTALEHSDWSLFFTIVESCHLPSSSTPHHWIELTSKSPDHTKYVWDGTNQFMKKSTIGSMKNASSEWYGYSDPSVERLTVLPEKYE